MGRVTSRAGGRRTRQVSGPEMLNARLGKADPPTADGLRRERKKTSPGSSACGSNTCGPTEFLQPTDRPVLCRRNIYGISLHSRNIYRQPGISPPLHTAETPQTPPPPKKKCCPCSPSPPSSPPSSMLTHPPPRAPRAPRPSSSLSRPS